VVFRRRDAGAGLDIDVGRVQGFVAGRAVQLDLRDLAARAVAE
jgi:hypothetical protein